MHSWVITLPQHVSWENYARELAAVADRTQALNYRVAHAPKDLKPGDRCYLVWRGRVRGWMEVLGAVEHKAGFTCQTLGAEWPPGTYIQRTGPFHYLDKGPAMRGFQGIRRYPWPVT